jgi:hypothetical protein
MYGQKWLVDLSSISGALSVSIEKVKGNILHYMESVQNLNIGDIVYIFQRFFATYINLSDIKNEIKANTLPLQKLLQNLIIIKL